MPLIAQSSIGGVHNPRLNNMHDPCSPAVRPRAAQYRCAWLAREMAVVTRHRGAAVRDHRAFRDDHEPGLRISTSDPDLVDAMVIGHGAKGISVHFGGSRLWVAPVAVTVVGADSLSRPLTRIGRHSNRLLVGQPAFEDP